MSVFGQEHQCLCSVRSTNGDNGYRSTMVTMVSGGVTFS